MTAPDAYKTLATQEKRMHAIGGALAVLHWDRAVMMPEGGVSARAEQMAALQLIVHEMQVAPARGELIETAKAASGDLDEWQRANLREIEWRYVRATARPADLVEKLAHARAETEMAWRRARANNDFAALAPKLANLLSLAREEAQALGEALGLDPYDALLDGYDPGLRMAYVEPLFAELAREIPPILDAVLARQQAAGPALPLEGPFPVPLQEKLGRAVMERLGFDFTHGRLDVSHHPFSGGVPDDCRITTRYEGDDFIQTLMAVIHETGHALYQRGLPQDWRGQPVGDARGMVVHESQSLMFEMQAARSPAFISWLAGLVRETFGRSGPAWETQNLLRHYHHVERGLIRVHADEVTYPLHIVLRTGLERDMIAGRLKVAELPDAWRAGMADLLGVTPPDDATGCMQDIHWNAGSFGYFPTYTLGALAAAQLFDAAMRADPAIEQELAQGRDDALLGWARLHIHSQGSLKSSGDLIEAASGAPLGTGAFLAHLKSRYLGGDASALAAATAAK